MPLSRITTIRLEVIALLAAVAALSSCGGSSSTSNPPPPPPNPLPSITSLSPSSTSTGGAAFTLTVNGSNFISASAVQWNGSSRTTSYVSATQVTAAITATDIANAGTASVTVVNPAPGGGASPPANLAISDPVPSISSLSPTNANAGGATFTLTVNGSNFISTSTIMWNGISYTTAHVSATQVTAAIPASDIATAGTASITVENPAPGGGTSSAANFTISGTIPGNDFFVSPTGSDSNSGTIAQPYLTIQKCATTTPSGGTCELRAGTYHETVTPNSGITITSYDGESVTVDGSDPVTGWTLYQGSIYKASATLSAGDTNQLFVDNQMMTEARWPNGDDLFHVNWATARAGTTTSVVMDSNLPNINWTGAKIHLWSGTDPFGHQTGVVTAASQGQVSIDVGQTATCPAICPATGGYYYLFGILGALDIENEWAYDSTAHVLYFWAPAGVDPNTLNVRAKQRQYAFDLRGKSNVTIQNIGIFASGVTTDTTSAGNILDRINAQYVSHFTTLPPAAGDTTGYTILSVGEVSGIVFNGSGNILRNSTIDYSAGSGVVLIGSNNTVTNNQIRHIDYVGDYSSGIIIFGNTGNGSSVQNNTIDSVGRQAILLSSSVNLSGEDIGYNNLFNAMMLSRDGGEIYACCNFGAGANVHHNWIHDTQSLISGAADNYPAAGVYVDNGTSGFEVDQNVLWNNQYQNVILHGAGATTPNDNNVHNNSIPDVNTSAYIWLNDIPNCGTTQVIDNLVLVPLTQASASCTATDNSATAPGANEMNSSVQVGCNFAGCSSEGPPPISGSSVGASIAVQPLSITVAAGQTAMFTATAAGSAPLSYQWQKNGVNIAGATSASYTTPATTSADNGAAFTVQVSNSVGNVTSNPAILTVN